MKKLQYDICQLREKSSSVENGIHEKQRSILTMIGHNQHSINESRNITKQSIAISNHSSKKMEWKQTGQRLNSKSVQVSENAAEK